MTDATNDADGHLFCMGCKTLQVFPWCVAHRTDCTSSLPHRDDVPSIFPVLDAPREFADTELGRVVIEEFNAIEPYIEETDSWAAMPLRVVHDQGNGFHIEIGPYSLGNSDIRRLVRAIQRLVSIEA